MAGYALGQAGAEDLERARLVLLAQRSALAAGWDIQYGARLVTDLQALELTDVQGENVIRDERGGSPR